MKKIGQFLSSLVLILSLVSALLLIVPLIPGVNHFYQLAIVKSGSMEPSLPVGSLAVYQLQMDYFPGEIIAYRTGDGDDSKLIIHRIVSKQTQGNQVSFLTQGDATQYLSPSAVLLSQVQGKVLTHLPYLGFILLWLKSGWGTLLIMALILVWLVKSEFLSRV